LIGRPVKIVVEKGRLRPEKSEVMRLISDNRKAQELLGWALQVGFRDGLAKTIDWIREHLEWYRVGRYTY